MRPTPPAAAWMRTVSPSFSRAMRCRRNSAVMPLRMPAADRGRADQHLARSGSMDRAVARDQHLRSAMPLDHDRAGARWNGASRRCRIARRGMLAEGLLHRIKAAFVDPLSHQTHEVLFA